MFVMCPSAGRSAECCVILALMVAPRGRALVFLNMGCGRQKTATSEYRAWVSRRRAVERTSPTDVTCAMYAHQTHVHSWEAANWRTQLKLVAKEDTTKPTVYR